MFPNGHFGTWCTKRATVWKFHDPHRAKRGGGFTIDSEMVADVVGKHPVRRPSRSGGRAFAPVPLLEDAAVRRVVDPLAVERDVDAPHLGGGNWAVKHRGGHDVL